MPALPEDLRKRGLLFLYAGEPAKAKDCFTKAVAHFAKLRETGLRDQDQQLGKMLDNDLARSTALEVGEIEAAALAAWDKAEALFNRKAMREAKDAYDAFTKQYGQTKTATQMADTLKERYDQIEVATGPPLPKRLRAAFSGEVLKAEPDGYVEVRYDGKKGLEGWKDFLPGDNWQIATGGISASGRQYESKDLTYLPRFRPETLHVEVVIQSAFHDIIIGRLGAVNIQVRWGGNGQLAMVYKPNASGRVAAGGAAWNHPNSIGGRFRYVFSRTLDSARFLLDGTEQGVFKLEPEKVKKEDPAVFSLWVFHDSAIKEVLVKGTVDHTWLMSRTSGR